MLSLGDICAWISAFWILDVDFAIVSNPKKIESASWGLWEIPQVFFPHLLSSILGERPQSNSVRVSHFVFSTCEKLYVRYHRKVSHWQLNKNKNKNKVIRKKIFSIVVNALNVCSSAQRHINWIFRGILILKQTLVDNTWGILLKENAGNNCSTQFRELHSGHKNKFYSPFYHSQLEIVKKRAAEYLKKIRYSFLVLQEMREI